MKRLPVLLAIQGNNFIVQTVTESWGQILGKSSTCQNKKNIHIYTCLKTFKLWIMADRIHLSVHSISHEIRCTLLHVSCRGRCRYSDKLFFYLCGVHFVALFTYTIWTHNIYDIYIYMCNPQSQLFLFRLLPHYMFRPLRAIFGWNKCININSVFVKTITLYLIHPLLHVLLSILYYLFINSYIIFFKIV
jgi:hypothetical protein